VLIAKRVFLYTAGLILAAAAGGEMVLGQVPTAEAETLTLSRQSAVSDTLNNSGHKAAPADSLTTARKVKNPTGAMLRSMVVPGWGQWYNEKRFKAVVMMGAEAGLVIDAIVQNQLAARSQQLYEREYYRNNRSLAIWWLGAVILFSMADAYVDAHLFDFDERPELTLDPVWAPAGSRPCPEAAFHLAVHF